jgi:hypothetical protein
LEIRVKRRTLEKEIVVQRMIFRKMKITLKTKIQWNSNQLYYA